MLRVFLLCLVALSFAPEKGAADCLEELFDASGPRLDEFVALHRTSVGEKQGFMTDPMAAYFSRNQRSVTREEKPRVADYWNQGIHENVGDKNGDALKKVFGKARSDLVPIGDELVSLLGESDQAEYQDGISNDICPQGDAGNCAFIMKGH